jgi:very-short-patch-repair endonuclease
VSQSSAISEFKRRTAKRLRQHATDAEVKLWRRLKRLETRGTHFRRQMPIGDYMVDFACPAIRLVIEVDGSQHGESAARIRDETRTKWLEAQGYRVVRFWNNEVTTNMEGVMDAIYANIYGAGDAEPHILKHTRHRRTGRTQAITPPRRAARADPPPPGEGEDRT